MLSRCLLLSLILLISACGGGVSNAPLDGASNEPTEQNQAGAPLAAEYNDLVPFINTGTFAPVLKGCAALDIDQFQDDYSCQLSELPFIGQNNPSPTVDDIMARVAVSHTWMGDRFRDALEVMPADMLLLFRSITAVVIDADIRPAYYWGGTAAIYLDPDYIWTTNAEKATVSQQEDFRAGFGNELIFVDAWRYTKDNNYAFPAWSLSDNVERTVEQMSMDLMRLLYHELAHANDFMPPAALDNLNSNDSALEALEASASQWISNRLYDDSPVTSQIMLDLADTRFSTGEATDVQKTYTAEFVGSEHANDSANHFYGYSTRREDAAMMFEAVMMKRNFDIEMDIGYLVRPANDDPTCDDYLVGWGKRNLIGSAQVKNRAHFVASNMLPDLDWTTFLQNLDSDQDMTTGSGWCANLVLNSNAPVAGRQAIDRAANSDRWRDLNPRIH